MAGRDLFLSVCRAFLHSALGHLSLTQQSRGVGGVPKGEGKPGPVMREHQGQGRAIGKRCGPHTGEQSFQHPCPGAGRGCPPSGFQSWLEALLSCSLHQPQFPLVSKGGDWVPRAWAVQGWFTLLPKGVLAPPEEPSHFPMDLGHPSLWTLHLLHPMSVALTPPVARLSIALQPLLGRACGVWSP